MDKSTYVRWFKQAAGSLGVSNVNFRFIRPGEHSDELGEYDPGKNEISIDERILSNDRLATQAGLHELAHAYHNRTVRMSFGNLEIKAAYEKAKASGKYERVERKDSEGRSRMERAYAMTNPQEYFAECTEAYFTRNDFFPFTREELKQHDPEMFALLEKLWGVQP